MDWTEVSPGDAPTDLVAGDWIRYQIVLDGVRGESQVEGFGGTHYLTSYGLIAIGEITAYHRVPAPEAP